MLWFVLVVGVLLLGGALFVDQARRRGPAGGGDGRHPDDPESKFFNRYGSG
jgi:hypothetical protein